MTNGSGGIVDQAGYLVEVDHLARPSEPGTERVGLKDTQGRFRTLSLFYETRHDSYPAYFTLKKEDIERDGLTYISMYRKYMEISDPTEYAVAQRLMGSWDHWQLLASAKWFKEHLVKWREELAVKLESERFWEMRAHVDKDPGSPQSIQATKWLAEKYGQKPDPKRGRPSKAEKTKYLKELKQDSEEQADDAARIGLV